MDDKGQMCTRKLERTKTVLQTPREQSAISPTGTEIEFFVTFRHYRFAFHFLTRESSKPFAAEFETFLISLHILRVT